MRVPVEKQSATFLSERLAMAPDLSSHRDHWSLEIFQMSTRTKQQRVLKAFSRVGMPGVQVLGVVRLDSWFVIVDSVTIADEIRARRILLTVDPAAVRSHRAGPRRRPDRISPRTPQPCDRPDGQHAALVELESHGSMHRHDQLT